MKSCLLPIVVSTFVLAGCVTDYTKSEAPNNLRVDGTETRVDISFAPGSARLAPGEAARLDQLVATGVIRPADRVTIAAAGPSALAQRRAAVVSSTLLAYGIVTDTLPGELAPPNRATIGIGRYTVTLPPCPNWSSPPGAEYTNAHNSNWGCAAATNLGLMVANPADLVSGRTMGPSPAQPAVNAVQRYMTDRVKQPPTPTASPFAAPTGGGGGGDTGAAPPGAGREPEPSNEVIAFLSRTQTGSRGHPRCPPRAVDDRSGSGDHPGAAAG
jgi:pilus assembly protein CpaD